MHAVFREKKRNKVRQKYSWLQSDIEVANEEEQKENSDRGLTALRIAKMREIGGVNNSDGSIIIEVRDYGINEDEDELKNTTEWLNESIKNSYNSEIKFKGRNVEINN
ncbi:2502_t:CDS:2 [Entrophospora sp. SA101]|nr:2502_t:CDS:2 [Entrophospora sp. SA101]